MDGSPRLIGRRRAVQIAVGAPSTGPTLPAEVNLVRGVIVQALEDLLDCAEHRRPRLRFKMVDRQQTYEWFASPSEEPWSWRWCCEMAGLDPGAVLKALVPGWRRPLRQRHM